MLNFTALEILILVLATFRISFMLTSEDGSFSVTYAIRLLGGNVRPLTNQGAENGTSKVQAWKDSLVAQGRPILYTNHFGKLIGCIYCTSVWVGILIVPLYEYLRGTVLVYGFWGLAMSAAAIIVSRYLQR